MKKNKKFGFLSLAKTTMAVITTSLASLNTHGAKADTPEKIKYSNFKINNIITYKRITRPKLVLKLNISNPSNSLTAMHTSHRSHASHSSHYSGSSTGHSSHASHSSHYSSSTSSSSTPVYRPSSTETSSTSSSYKSSTTPTASNVIYFTLTRVLVLGCQGADVEYIQNLLVLAGYSTPSAGYFGSLTQTAVIKFQKENGLTPDGKFGITNFKVLKTKVYGY